MKTFYKEKFGVVSGERRVILNLSENHNHVDFNELVESSGMKPDKLKKIIDTLDVWSHEKRGVVKNKVDHSIKNAINAVTDPKMKKALRGWEKNPKQREKLIQKLKSLGAFDANINTTENNNKTIEKFSDPTNLQKLLKYYKQSGKHNELTVEKLKGWLTNPRVQAKYNELKRLNEKKEKKFTRDVIFNGLNNKVKKDLHISKEKITISEDGKKVSIQISQGEVKREDNNPNIRGVIIITQGNATLHMGKKKINVTQALGNGSIVDTAEVKNIIQTLQKDQENFNKADINTENSTNDDNENKHDDEMNQVTSIDDVSTLLTLLKDERIQENKYSKNILIAQTIANIEGKYTGTLDGIMDSGKATEKLLTNGIETRNEKGEEIIIKLGNNKISVNKKSEEITEIDESGTEILDATNYIKLEKHMQTLNREGVLPNNINFGLDEIQNQLSKLNLGAYKFEIHSIDDNIKTFTLRLQSTIKVKKVDYKYIHYDNSNKLFTLQKGVKNTEDEITIGKNLTINAINNALLKS